MSVFRRLLRLAVMGGVFLGVMGVSGLVVLYWLIWPTLPSVESLRDTQFQLPLAVYSADDRLMAQFGETRRYPVTVDQVPLRVRQAFIAAEDAHFYQHPGIDWRGITRAVWLLATTSDRRVPGGSTITQQVAKLFFLSSEYSYTRKVTEIFLALKMERELSKDEILALYLNKSFFGNRAYGVAAAAEFYYGKSLEGLTLEEGAMLASIPKFPSSGNPVVNPARALSRRNYVLDRMLQNEFITEAEYAAALAIPDAAAPHEPPVDIDAPWIAELVRQEAVDRFGELALTNGYRIQTTVDSKLQEAANLATRKGLLDYDQRHGWRGAEAKLTLTDGDDPQAWQPALRDRQVISGLIPAVVLAASDDLATLALADGQQIELTLEKMAWARAYRSENERGPAPTKTTDVLARGDVVRVVLNEDGSYSLSQLPLAQASVIALDHENGAVRALTGGFSFALNKFNRATQSQRQPGSSFKPFVYASAFERGFTPASIVLDAPVVFNDTGAGKSWRPQNDNQTFAGPMRLREAMVTSRNLVSVRVLDAVGIGFARRYMENFGFAPESLPANLSLALGSNAAPPIAMVRGYAVFANGGYRVTPWFIREIQDRDGNVLFTAVPERACSECTERRTTSASSVANEDEGFNLGPTTAAIDPPAAPEPTQDIDTIDDTTPEYALAPRAIDARTAYMVHSLLRDVVRRGTGRGALVLERSDIGGKTGTTNDHRDVWFSGFGGPLAVTAWVGIDDFSPLGNREFASVAALPIWIDFMRVALEGEPEHQPALPEGITTALIDPNTGRLVGPGTPGAISEIFKIEDIARLERQVEQQTPADQAETFDIF